MNDIKIKNLFGSKTEEFISKAISLFEETLDRKDGKKNSPLFAGFRHGDTSVLTGGNPVPTDSISTKTESPTGLKLPLSGMTEKTQTASALDATNSTRSLRRSSVIECHPNPKNQGYISHRAG